MISNQRLTFQSAFDNTIQSKIDRNEQYLEDLEGCNPTREEEPKYIKKCEQLLNKIEMLKMQLKLI